jgi:methylmalonyl-CoA mutase cobalamin-binding domain/chain
VGPHLCRTLRGETDPKLRRFRYGVQVNSLGLTEQQPENNVARIVIETNVLRDVWGEYRAPTGVSGGSGFEVIYQGIRQSPAQITATARDEDVDVVGLSILSGSHVRLVTEVMELLADAKVDVPVVAGGIVPPEDERRLLDLGVTGAYTPKDFQLARIMTDLADLLTGQLLI